MSSPPPAGVPPEKPHGTFIPKQRLLVEPLLPVLLGVVLMVLLAWLSLSDPPVAQPAAAAGPSGNALQRFTEVHERVRALEAAGDYLGVLEAYATLPDEVRRVYGGDLSVKELEAAPFAADQVERQARALLRQGERAAAIALVRRFLALEVLRRPQPDARTPSAVARLEALAAEAAREE